MPRINIVSYKYLYHYWDDSWKPSCTEVLPRGHYSYMFPAIASRWRLLYHKQPSCAEVLPRGHYSYMFPAIASRWRLLYHKQPSWKLIGELSTDTDANNNNNSNNNTNDTNDKWRSYRLIFGIAKWAKKFNWNDRPSSCSIQYVTKVKKATELMKVFTVLNCTEMVSWWYEHLICRRTINIV